MAPSWTKWQHRIGLSATLAGCTLAATSTASAATLPEHDPLSIVVISDWVNPHNLDPADLTEPGEIGPALEDPASGLNIASVSESESDCVDDALAAITAGNVDVIVYFAHRPAFRCAGGDAQVELTAAFETHLQAGGGIVVFHHGLYSWAGKEDVLQLLGGVANAINWDTVAGQNVIATAPDHFVTSNAIEYSGNVDIGAPNFGVDNGNYAMFNNTPDEQYQGAQALTEAGEERTTLFLSDYAGPQLLSYDLKRSGWAGRVVWYQPGEYQPNALDDKEGNNFQILANAIYYVGTSATDPVGTGTATATATDGPSFTSGDATDSAGGSNTSGVATSSASAGTDGGGVGGTASTVPMADDGDDDITCSCRAGNDRPPLGLAVMLLAGLLSVRRRNPTQ